MFGIVNEQERPIQPIQEFAQKHHLLWSGSQKCYFVSGIIDPSNAFKLGDSIAKDYMSTFPNGQYYFEVVNSEMGTHAVTFIFS